MKHSVPNTTFSVASRHTSDDQLQQSRVWLGVLQPFSLQESLHCHWQPGRCAGALCMVASAYKDVDSDRQPALALPPFLKLPNLATQNLEGLIHVQPMQIQQNHSCRNANMSLE